MDVLVTTPEQACAEALEGLKQILSGNYEPLEIRHQIQILEKAMEQMPQADQPLQHYFTEGLYGRKIFNPKGSVIVTKIHKAPNISFLLSGKLGVVTEDGCTILSGPQMFITRPGTKRVIFAMEDTTFATVHPNPDNADDLEVLESRIIAKDFDELTFELSMEGKPCLG